MVLVLPAHIARRQAGVLHRRQLRASGWSDAAVRRATARGDLLAVDDHVFIASAAPPTWHQRIWVDLLLCAPGAAVSHRTAAQLRRVGRFTTGAVDVLELEEVRHLGRAAHVHRTTWLPTQHLGDVDGIPVTSLARTVFDLAGLVSPARRWRGLPSVNEQQVARTLDDALVRGLDLAELEQVLATLGGRGRPGTVLIRDLISERSDGRAATASELEDLMRVVLDRFGIREPERQIPLGGEDRDGIVDFVFRPERVVIEADGRTHHTALLDAEHDRWRDLRLAADGFVVVRVTQRQLVRDAERFATGLVDLLERRSRQFADPPALLRTPGA